MLMEQLRLNILIVEDNTGDFLLIQQMLKDMRNYELHIRHVETIKETIDAIVEQRPDVILLDLSLPDSYGIDSFTRVVTMDEHVPILILSGLNDKGIALEAVKKGAQDYLLKGEFDGTLLSKSIIYSIERKRNIELLRQSGETYKLLFDNNPIPMFIWEKESLLIKKANQAAVNRYGYSKEEFELRTISDIVFYEDKDLQSAARDSAMQDISIQYIIRHVTRNGELIDIEAREREIIVDGRKCFLVIADDITEKKKVQHEVSFQAEILHHVRDTIFVTDKAGIITYWNEGAELTFGFKREFIVGKSYGILYPEVFKASIKQELKDVFAGRKVQWEGRLLTNDAKILWVENRASLLYNDRNEITGMICAVKDNTISKRYAEKQKETVAMLDSIFQNVSHGIVLLDQHARIKAFNIPATRHFIELMGVEMVDNADFSSYLLDEMLDQFQTYFDEALHIRVQFEMVFRFSTTSAHWFNVNMSPVVDDSNVSLGVCLSMVDITERKLADERFKVQYLEIQHANLELDRLIKVLSHDLRAPMNSISGLITLARDEKDPAEFVTYLDMMDKSVKKLENFTKDIISSLKNRNSNISEEVELYEMIQEIQDELRFSKQAEGIRFINEIPQDLHIEADKMRLRIIFSNLISNAIKYHDPSKNDRFVRISVNKQPLHLEIAVQDNGIGIDTVHHHKVFESYYTVSNRSDSNGLGLSNVKDSVQKMGGSIQLESVPHVGSIFRVTIPSVKTKK